MDPITIGVLAAAGAAIIVKAVKVACKKDKCYHPVNGRCELLYNLSSLGETQKEYGFWLDLLWDSESGSLADLDTVTLREQVKYGPIPEKPFGKVMATKGGKTFHVGKLDGTSGRASDRHFFKWNQVTKPPVKGTFKAYQKYQWRCKNCGSGWKDLAEYTITRQVYEGGGKWFFRTKKVGPGGPFEEDVPVR